MSHARNADHRSTLLLALLSLLGTVVAVAALNGVLDPVLRALIG